jgi:hypothetical protein
MYSRFACIVGIRAESAKVLIRTRLVLAKAGAVLHFPAFLPLRFREIIPKIYGRAQKICP